MCYTTIMNTSKKVRRILGIDPGLANTGFGIIEFDGSRYKMLTYGSISTSPDAPHGERLLTIYNRLNALIVEFAPTEASMETLYFAKNVTSALAVSEARGAVSLCLAQNCIPLSEYSPNQIKKAVSGNTTADKALVQNFVKLLLGLETVPKPDHAADALAGAITHANYRN
ncbi:MAG: crossover junction endodeoxyribonuclease RuvC [Treponema sp.]|nr:crossover junction endodeoxyribonuclease RuvC [Candidatus Treponema merdequi]